MIVCQFPLTVFFIPNVCCQSRLPDTFSHHPNGYHFIIARGMALSDCQTRPQNISKNSSDIFSSDTLVIRH